MAQQEVNQLKAKLQAQEQQFQNYKAQCKQLQQFLQQQSQKKEAENRKLKEQIIKKQKGEKVMKAQISQLQAQLATITAQLKQAKQTTGQKKTGPSQQDSKKLQNMNLENEQLKIKCQNLSQQLKSLQEQLNKQKQLVKSFQQKVKFADEKVKSTQDKLKNAEEKLKIFSASNTSNIQNSKQKSIQKSNQKANEEFNQLKSKYNDLEKQKHKLQSQLKVKQDQHKKIIHQFQEKVKKLTNIKHKQEKSESKHEEIKERKLSVGKEIKEKTVSLNQHNNKMALLEEKNQQLQHKLEKQQKQIKQLKAKVKYLTDEKNHLQSKIKHQQQLLQKEREKNQYDSPIKESQIVHNDHQQIMIDDGQSSSLTTSCLLLTKKHYISPFIQLKDKQIKLFKNTKNGFQKSLGAVKHKFDLVGYDMNQIIQNSVNKIKSSGDGYNSIVIYGAKKTSKKYIMAELINNLKEYLLQKINQEENQPINVTYMIKSQQEQKNYQKVSNQKEQIEEILDKIIGLGTKDNKQKKPSKKGSKPKIRFFSLTIGSFTLQIFTTSHMNPFIKQGENLVDYLNTILFSKLPNVLQAAQTNCQIIATINPIVNLYQQCKNTLSITLVPSKDKSLMATPKRDWKEWNEQNGLNIDQLNDSAKKRLQSFQKQNQQVMIKMKRVQQQCNYYRGRFQQLESRLKNLLNTHNQQNTYLKKSPVTLSYEKMLKLVHTALSRNNNNSMSRTLLNTNQHLSSPSNNLQEQHHYVYEEDNKSLQEAF